MSETELSKKRLQWQCRRGMLELDVLLGRFLEEHYDKLSTVHKIQFVSLLAVSDPEIYSWLMQQQLPNAEFQTIVAIIKDWQNSL